MNRRRFLQGAAATLGAASQTPALASQAGMPAGTKMIGIQVGAVSFVDEGVEKVLDTFQRDAGRWPHGKCQLRTER